MKAKTIKKVLRKKIDEWLETIEDPVVKELAAKNTMVTGGAIASMLLRECVNDYDLYFRNEGTALAVAQYYVKQFNKANKTTYWVTNDDGRVRIMVKSAGIASESDEKGTYRYFENDPDPDAADATDYIEQALSIVQTDEELEDDKPPYRPVFLSANAITLSNKIQLVIRFFGEPDQIHENYDFVHVTNYWQSWDSQLVLRPPALECLLARELRYQGSKYPVCSVFRIRKYVQRGWSINAGQILKMCMQVSELDLTDINVLEDQLTGVDVAYFLEVINELRKKDKNVVNTTYLIEIIDRMF